MLKGKRKFDLFLRPWVERHDEISILIHSITEGGDLVVVERTDRHRLTGSAWASTQAAGFYRVREDRIVEWRDYFDLMPFCIQSGQRHEDIVRLAEKLAAAP
jgi:limonene-1,2-epoxide hydrolase